MEVLPIADSFDKNVAYQNLIERQFTTRYSLNVGEKNFDYCILFNPNKVCILTLAPSHPILAHNKTVERVQFSNDFRRFFTDGSGIKGVRVEPTTILCTVSCSDSSYSIPGCLSGKLVDINQKLFKDPNLMVQKPSFEGYIAMILPPAGVGERYLKELLTPEQYKEEMLKRQQQKSIS